MSESEILFAILRNDLKAFVQKAFYELEGKPLTPSINVDIICDTLVRSYLGERPRQIVNVPPRSLKSFIVTVCFPAWLLGNNPKAKIIALSYAQDLAAKFSRDTRRIMGADWYKRTFPKTRLNPNKSGENEFETTEGGFRMSTSVGGVLTGRGADYIIVDDPMKPTDAHSDTIRNKVNEWVDSTLFTRLDDKRNGKIIVVMQRLHSDDLTGHLADKGFDQLILPAIAVEEQCFFLLDGRSILRQPGDLLQPDRETQAVLDQLKVDMGSKNFSAQYQQQPVPFDGNILKKEWIHRFDRVSTRGIVLSLDVASGTVKNNDYSVCTVWGRREGYAYLVDVYRMRLDFPKLIQKIHEIWVKYGQYQRYLLIEENGLGLQLIQQLKYEGINAIGIRPQGDKVERFESVTPMFESGQVLLPKNEPWLAEYEHELLSFPSVKHDDQVDSTSQFLIWHQKSWNARPRVWKF